VLDWQTVERWRRWMDKRTLAVLDGRESAGIGHCGVAGLGTARWRMLVVLDWQREYWIDKR